MNNLFFMTPEQRQRSILMVSDKMKLIAPIVEKDFWVVWTLWRLFEQKEIKPFLTFKGGTSLSKVFGIIKRFSEDCDLSIEKDFFGFGKENAPELAPSRKKRTAILDNLSATCAKYVQTTLLGLLKDDFNQQLQNETTPWDVVIDPDDPDQQTLLFHYPTRHENVSRYVRPFVRLEMGARSEHWPVYEKVIHSYVKEHLHELVDEPDVVVKVLAIERTFWEKATILHQYAHKPPEKQMPARLARHYYDLHCLILSHVKKKAVAETDLLERAAKHKEIYFPASWANCQTARKGSLKLIPSEALLHELQQDYTLMREMFLEEPPTWDAIVETIAQFEKEFNQAL